MDCSARDFDGSTTDYTWAASPFTSGSCTLAAWMNNDSASVSSGLLSLGHSATDSGITLFAGGAVANDPVLLQGRNGGSGTNATTSTGYTTGVWHLASGSRTSATSRAAYIDGGSKGTSATNDFLSVGALNRVGLGVRYMNGAKAGLHDGRIALATVWNVTLTDEEHAALFTHHPYLVRPQNIVWHFKSAYESDDYGLAATKTGSPGLVEGPPLKFLPIGHTGIFVPRTFSVPTNTGLTITPNPSAEGAAVTITANATGDDVTVALVDADGDGTVDLTVSVGSPDTSFSYPTAGTFTPTVSVSGPGGSDSDAGSAHTVTVSVVAPTITTFTLAPTTAEVGDFITQSFTYSGGAPTLALSDMDGDGNGDVSLTATVVDSSYAYAVDGSFSVTLTLTNSAGSSTATIGPLTITEDTGGGQVYPLGSFDGVRSIFPCVFPVVR